MAKRAEYWSFFTVLSGLLNPRFKENDGSLKSKTWLMVDNRDMIVTQKICP